MSASTTSGSTATSGCFTAQWGFDGNAPGVLEAQPPTVDTQTGNQHHHLLLCVRAPPLLLQVVDSPEILTVIGQVPHLKEYLDDLYACNYKGFYKVGTHALGLTAQHAWLNIRHLQLHFHHS
jgi:hypothetical protein